MVSLIREEYPELPLFMLGHNIGGFITCLYGIKHPDKLEGQVFFQGGGDKKITSG